MLKGTTIIAIKTNDGVAIAGDVIEPGDGIAAIGSGGNYELAAGKALLQYSNLGIKEIVKEALMIAASICVFTNDNITVEGI